MSKDHNIDVLNWHMEVKEKAERVGLERLANMAKKKIIETQNLIYPDVKYVKESN